jgi:hypothetical protein
MYMISYLSLTDSPYGHNGFYSIDLSGRSKELPSYQQLGNFRSREFGLLEDEAKNCQRGAEN